MRSRPPSRAIVFVIACGSAVTACGSEDVFVPELASNERLIEREAIARLAKDDESIFQLAVVGDLDGDGIDDAVVSSYYMVRSPSGEDEQATSLYVLYGGSTVTGEIDLSTLPSLTGFGTSGTWISPVGDVDGDGRADFLACVLDGVYLVYGGAPRLSGVTQIADVGAFFHDATSVPVATSMAGLGDLDGDGKADFAITRPAAFGVPNDSNDSSDVFLFYGRSPQLSGTVDLASTADAVISEPMSYDYHVPEVARAGDVDGDGYSDFLLRLPSGPFGADIRLVRGAATRLAGTVAGPTIGVSQFAPNGSPCWNLDSFGGPLGDLDGDGFDDFVLTSCPDDPSQPGASRVQRVFYGRPGGFPAQVSLGEEDATFRLTEDGAGRLASGDVDGDGVLDLIVSDAGSHDRNGAVYVIKGNGVRLSGEIEPGLVGTVYVGRPERGTQCDYVATPDCIAHEAVGSEVGVGDFTGGRHTDILVSAPTDSEIAKRGVHGSGLGHAYLVAPSVRAKP